LNVKPVDASRNQKVKVLHKWLTAVRSEGKLVTGSVITKEAKFFNEQTQTTGRRTFCEGWLQD
jgi:hypothetical protein